MRVNQGFLAYVKDQLSEFGEEEIKNMFGGAGIFKEGIIFGMIGGDIFRQN
ncbi:MAG: TfoX/Sxy family protein [Gramella sp.]|nr:TfoX/Sxy family protein [Christiangramia sp.]